MQSKIVFAFKAQLQKGTKEVGQLREKLYHARRSKIEKIKKYLFPIQEELVFPVLGTPPTQDALSVMRGRHIGMADCQN